MGYTPIILWQCDFGFQIPYINVAHVRLLCTFSTFQPHQIRRFFPNFLGCKKSQKICGNGPRFSAKVYQKKPPKSANLCKFYPKIIDANVENSIQFTHFTPSTVDFFSKKKLESDGKLTNVTKKISRKPTSLWRLNHGFPSFPPQSSWIGSAGCVDPHHSWRLWHCL